MVRNVPVLKVGYVKHIYLYKCIDMVPKVPVNNLIKSRSREVPVLKLVYLKHIYLYKCIDMVPKVPVHNLIKARS